MGRLQRRKVSSQEFSEAQQRAVLESVGLEVVSETVNDFLILCPYHGNNDTPSLSLSKDTGQFICFNPACYEKGTIVNIVQHVCHCNYLEAMRLVLNKSTSSNEDVVKSILKSVEEETSFAEFDRDKIEELHRNLKGSAGFEYMISRGFTSDTLEFFKIGYSHVKSMVTVPVYSHTNIPVGIIGRSIEGKRFKNSVKFPSSKVFFNLNEARKHSSTAVIVESSFDAMRVHQSGFSNVIANLGGHLSNIKIDLLNRNFTKVIIMTDNDSPQFREGCKCGGSHCVGHNPGRELGEKIAQSFSREVYWAKFNENEVYPRGAKDPGDMTDDEISFCIKNAVSDVEYQLATMV